MRITDILSASGVGGFFYDDQLAIRRGVERDGEWYKGSPITEGFVSVRMRAASLGLVLEDGSVHWGDAVSVPRSLCGADGNTTDPQRISSCRSPASFVDDDRSAGDDSALRRG